MAAVPVALAATTAAMSMALQAVSACNQISQEQLLVMAAAAALRVGLKQMAACSLFLLTAVQMDNQLLAPTVAVVELLLFPAAQA